MTRKRTMVTPTPTLVDVVIPAGSNAFHEPYRRLEIMDYVSVSVVHFPNVTSEWLIPRQDAIDMGVVPPDFPSKAEKKEESEKTEEPEPDNLA